MSDALGFLPDTKPDVAEPWRKVLLDAADYIDKHGWWQSSGGCGNQGERCVGLAIVDSALRLDGPYGCVGKLSTFLGFSGGGIDIIRWNDAPGRTAAEVTAALRACARQ